MTGLPLALAADVAAALAARRPVVALESTIITHGMPPPNNVETALRVERIIRDGGAMPATIAVIDGVLRVGLSEAELRALAVRSGIGKLSRADLAIALATGASGSTTVAATMIAARLAGIEVFATGGIGGVHRGAEATFDVSADLHELAQTPVTVVSAGAKAILDVPKTLEVLETLGVAVIGYRTDRIPAFWSRDSGLDAPLRLDDAGAIAAAHVLRARLGIPGGQLVCNPIPASAEIARSKIDAVIADACAVAAAEGVTGKAVTPFLLDEIFRRTGGRSLAANIALVESNAALAAEIAVALAVERARA